MPQALTKQFGTIEYREEETVEFPLGLPAFEEERKFLTIERPETRPLVFLQSLSHADLCFVTLPLLLVDPVYQLAVSAEDLRVLGLADLLHSGAQPEIGRDVRALAIMSVTNSRPSANLLAPVLINIPSPGGSLARPLLRGVQAIRADAQYSHEQIWEGPPCS